MIVQAWDVRNNDRLLYRGVREAFQRRVLDVTRFETIPVIKRARHQHVVFR